LAYILVVIGFITSVGEACSLVISYFLIKSVISLKSNSWVPNRKRVNIKRRKKMKKVKMKRKMKKVKKMRKVKMKKVLFYSVQYHYKLYSYAFSENFKLSIYETRFFFPTNITHTVCPCEGKEIILHLAFVNTYAPQICPSTHVKDLFQHSM
jgi:hypothetical protein